MSKFLFLCCSIIKYISVIHFILYIKTETEFSDRVFVEYHYTNLVNITLIIESKDLQDRILSLRVQI